MRWRTVAEHHAVQQQGRDEVLDDYHLRIGDVTADTAGPVHEQRFDMTEIARAKVVTLTEVTPTSGRELTDAADLPDALGLGLSAAAVAGPVRHRDRPRRRHSEPLRLGHNEIARV